MRLRRGKRVVAVPDRKDKIVLISAVKILHGANVIFKNVNDFLCVYTIPFEMSAAHIEIEIVHFFKACALAPNRFDDGVLSVVYKQHDMRQFHGSVLPYFEARRYSVENDAFG